MADDRETKLLSLDLADILRERIDACAKFKRHLGPYSKVLRKALRDEALSDDEQSEADSALFSALLKLFLDSKEGLIIPDDGLRRFAVEWLTDVPEIDLTLAYQDFYAYQFVDKLNDVVRRALRVRNLFAKSCPPEHVMRLCSQAYQCYLHGYHAASITLIRTLIETALKQRLGVDVGELSKLNDAGLGRELYPKKIWHKIDEIRKEGNRYVHQAVTGNSSPEAGNLALLGKAQEVLQVLVE